MGTNSIGKLVKKSDLNKSLKMKVYTFQKFRHMCILSGCDYASSIRGIGLERAGKVVKSTGEKGIKWALQNMREILKMPSIIVSDSYYDRFSLADKIFQHQAVFNPSTKKVVPLSGDTSNEYFVSRSQYSFAVHIYCMTVRQHILFSMKMNCILISANEKSISHDVKMVLFLFF